MVLIEFDGADSVAVLAAILPSSPSLARKITFEEGSVSVVVLHSGVRQFGPDEVLRLAFQYAEPIETVALGVVAALLYDCIKAGVKSFRWEGRRYSPIDLAQIRELLELPMPSQSPPNDGS